MAPSKKGVDAGAMAKKKQKKLERFLPGLQSSTPARRARSSSPSSSSVAVPAQDAYAASEAQERATSPLPPRLLVPPKLSQAVSTATAVTATATATAIATATATVTAATTTCAASSSSLEKRKRLDDLAAQKVARHALDHVDITSSLPALPLSLPLSSPPRSATASPALGQTTPSSWFPSPSPGPLPSKLKLDH